MSRIGARPIKIEDGVNIDISGHNVVASFGDKKLSVPISENLTVKQVENNLIVERHDNTKEAKSRHGLTSRLLRNIIQGVKEGFTKELTFTGTGYRVSVDNNKDVVLNMGYSHEVRLEIPQGLTVEVKKNHIFVKGSDKFSVGQFAAIIRNVRGPEVYKGKGIKYIDEIIKRKAGKKASS